MAELSGHTGPVTSVSFHPAVLLLATASLDRTVRIFDLENFTQVAVSGTELAASTVRRMAFHPTGACLYVATSDYLKVSGPINIVNNLINPIADMLIICSLN